MCQCNHYHLECKGFLIYLYYMRNFLLLSFVLLTTSCATFKVSTLNHDPIYDGDGNEIEINVINSQSQFDRLLRTDFTFRYNYAQYALSQPRSFDWNNRILGNRFNFYNPYGFNSWNTSYMSRDMMWNDWVWGYNGWDSWGSPHRWSPFGYDRWGYNIHYGWNNHGWGYNGYYGNGWNNYHGNGWNNYGQNSWYGRRGRSNVSYINGRRGSTMSVQDRIGQASMIESTKRIKRVVKPIRTEKTVVIPNNIIKPIRTRPNNNNTRPVRVYNRPVNNTRPVRVYNRPETNTRINNNHTTPTNRSSTTVRTSRSGTVKRKQ